MKTVIVLGGYGGFGSRLSQRLAADGWSVLVAGRNGDAAAALAARLPNARPLVADRNADLTPLLEQHRPMLLIDAAGPFQGSGYQVVQACIACGVNYIDLADARDFVGGIESLDAAAREGGVVVLSGGSSVPVLSGAVIAELGRDMDDVRQVSISISASSRAAAGASVAAAILSYVGRPVRLWRGRRWQQETGWHMLRCERYVVAHRRPITRVVALSDVPDHDVVPQMVRGKPATIFRAGPEFTVQLAALWLASWLVRAGWLGSLSGLSKWLQPLQKVTSYFGTDRSAMAVELKGVAAGKPLVRRWTLIAEDGDGPEIPTIAAQLLANAVAEGRLATGAGHAAGKLALKAFDRHLDRLSTFREIVEKPYVPLYHRVMRTAFDTLPPSVRDMHQLIGDAGAAGTATVRRGRSPLARLVCAVMRFPPEGAHNLHVAFEEHRGRERWTRTFSGRSFTSELSQCGAFLCERFGPMRFYFDLPADPSGLRMAMRKWSIFHIPMPLALAPRSEAREWGEGEDFCFDVPIALPGIGEIIRYTGRLRRL